LKWQKVGQRGLKLPQNANGEKKNKTCQGELVLGGGREELKKPFKMVRFRKECYPGNRVKALCGGGISRGGGGGVVCGVFWNAQKNELNKGRPKTKWQRD